MARVCDGEREPRVFNADGRLTEGPGVLPDRYLDPACRSRWPQVVGADGQACNVEADDELLPQVVWLIGADELLFVSDMPHGDREPMVEKRNDSAESAKRKIRWDSALRFYGLSQARPAQQFPAWPGYDGFRYSPSDSITFRWIERSIAPLGGTTFS